MHTRTHTNAHMHTHPCNKGELRQKCLRFIKYLHLNHFWSLYVKTFAVAKFFAIPTFNSVTLHAGSHPSFRHVTLVYLSPCSFFLCLSPTLVFSIWLVLWFEFPMSPIGSWVWTLDPKPEWSERRWRLEEVEPCWRKLCHGRRALKAYSLAPLPFLSLPASCL